MPLLLRSRLFLLFCLFGLSCGAGDVAKDDDTSERSPGEGRSANDCRDGADNDGNGLFDCDDPGCMGSPDCPTEADTDTDTDTDADSDADADTDTDTDTDADTDADTEPYSRRFEGEGAEVRHDCGEVSGEAWVGCHTHCVGGDDHIIYGPYQELEAGTYTASWRLKTNDGDRSSLNILQLDVVKDSGSVYLGERDVNRSEFSDAGVWREFEVAFVHDGAGALEYRVQFVDTHRPCVWVDWIQLDRID